MAKLPKPITRKRAAILGAGAGGGLVAYREVPKLLKPVPMYSQDQYVAKALSRSTGLSVEGVRRSMRRNKDRGRSDVRKALVRKDDWAQEQRYLQERERADAKRRRGANFFNAGATMVGTTGLAGLDWSKRGDPHKFVHIGGRGKPLRTLVSHEKYGKGSKVPVKSFRLAATKGPLVWAGTGAGLMGIGVAHRTSADRQDKRTAGMLRAELANERNRAIAQRDEAIRRQLQRDSVP